MRSSYKSFHIFVIVISVCIPVILEFLSSSVAYRVVYKQPAEMRKYQDIG